MFYIRYSLKSTSLYAYFYPIHAISQISIVIAGGYDPSIWAERGIAVGGVRPAGFVGLQLTTRLVMFFTVFLHGFTPRLGVYAMNVCRLLVPCSRKCSDLYQVLSLFKIAILVFIVVTSKSPHFSGRSG